MLTENTVTVSGALHLIHGQMIRESKSGRYACFSVRQDTPTNDGGIRKDFLLVRSFDPGIQAWIQEQAEGTTVRVTTEVPYQPTFLPFGGSVRGEGEARTVRVMGGTER